MDLPRRTRSNDAQMQDLHHRAIGKAQWRTAFSRVSRQNQYTRTAAWLTYRETRRSILRARLLRSRERSDRDRPQDRRGETCGARGYVAAPETGRARVKTFPAHRMGLAAASPEREDRRCSC